MNHTSETAASKADGVETAPVTEQPESPASVQQPQSWDETILSWGGLRPKLEDAGLTLEAYYLADFSRDFTGGADAGGNNFRSLLDLRVNADMEKMVGLPGGTLSIDFQWQAGSNGTDKLGDAQGYDNIDADRRVQISELWYEQWLFDKKFRLKVGKVDANSEFAFPEYAGEFLNSSFGFSPTIFVMPTYPDSALSLNLFGDITECCG